jgi:hypothetical protein
MIIELGKIYLMDLKRFPTKHDVQFLLRAEKRTQPDGYSFCTLAATAGLNREFNTTIRATILGSDCPTISFLPASFLDVGIEKEVLPEELPLYIGWPYLNREFCEILKKGIL